MITNYLNLHRFSSKRYFRHAELDVYIYHEARDLVRCPQLLAGGSVNNTDVSKGNTPQPTLQRVNGM